CLIQAVIAVLDSLDDRDWTKCMLEPKLGADKIALLLRSPSGDRVSQVKSSKNAIGAADVRKWTEELEAAYPSAKQYELRLTGPVTSGVVSVTRTGKIAGGRGDRFRVSRRPRDQDPFSRFGSWPLFFLAPLLPKVAAATLAETTLTVNVAPLQAGLLLT